MEHLLSVALALQWGAFGGFSAGGLDFIAQVRRFRCFPWLVAFDADGTQLRIENPQEARSAMWAYLIANMILCALGAGVAVAARDTGQISGPFAAIAVGFAAPKLLSGLMETVSLSLDDLVAGNSKDRTPPRSARLPRRSPADDSVENRCDLKS